MTAKKEEKAEERTGPEFIIHVDLKGDLPDFQIGYGEKLTKAGAESKAVALIKQGWVSTVRKDSPIQRAYTVFYPAHQVHMISVKEADIIVPPPPAKVKR